MVIDIKEGVKKVPNKEWPSLYSRGCVLNLRLEVPPTGPIITHLSIAHQVGNPEYISHSKYQEGKRGSPLLCLRRLEKPLDLLQRRDSKHSFPLLNFFSDRHFPNTVT